MDIAPGWRLRVVTPLLRSGGYLLSQDSGATKPLPPGSSIEIRTGGDFLGYETAIYAVGPGARIRLTSVEAMIDGKLEPRSKPTAKLFAVPGSPEFLRLVFLTRVSAADHDMAVLTARRYEDLEAHTLRLQSAPDQNCLDAHTCSWIPKGIAVRAEKPTASGEWIPADAAGPPRPVRPPE